MNERSHIMTIQFQIGGMEEEEGLRRQVGADLEALNCLMTVASAHVALQRQDEVTPAYQAVAMVAVAGSEIHAAARDHTWPAAWQKVVARLREQMEQRRSRQTPRKASRTSTTRPAAGRRRSGTGDLRL